MICSILSEKSKKAMLTLCVVVGIVSILFGAVGAYLTPEEQHSTTQLMGMLCGLGFGILFVAAVLTIRSRFVKPEKLEQEKIEAQDERNVALVQMALSVAAYVALMMFAVFAFVFVGLGYSLPGFLCIVGMYVEVAAFVVARAVLSKKM